LAERQESYQQELIRTIRFNLRTGTRGNWISRNQRIRSLFLQFHQGADDT